MMYYDLMDMSGETMGTMVVSTFCAVTSRNLSAYAYVSVRRIIEGFVIQRSTITGGMRKAT